MDAKLVETIKRSHQDDTTEELIQIYEEHDEAEWTKEAFEAVRQLLLERNESIPEIRPKPLPEVKPEPKPVGRVFNGLAHVLVLFVMTPPLLEDVIEGTEWGMFLARAAAFVIVWLSLIDTVIVGKPRQKRSSR